MATLRESCTSTPGRKHPARSPTRRAFLAHSLNRCHFARFLQLPTRTRGGTEVMHEKRSTSACGPADLPDGGHAYDRIVLVVSRAGRRGRGGICDLAVRASPLAAQVFGLEACSHARHSVRRLPPRVPGSSRQTTSGGLAADTAATAPPVPRSPVRAGPPRHTHRRPAH